MLKKQSVTPVGHRERRRHWRFAATYRVEFDLRGRPVTSFMRDLSQGGMFLRSANGLRKGDEMLFRLNLTDSREPLAIRGRVVDAHIDGNNGTARVEFLDHEEEAKRLHEFVNQNVIADLERSMKQPSFSVGKLLDLAAFYREFGRSQAALHLYHHGLKTYPRNVEIYERIVELMLSMVEKKNTKNEQLLDELDVTIASGLKIRPTPSLLALQTDAQAIRARLEQLELEHKRQQIEKQHATKTKRAIATALTKCEADLRASHAKELHSLRERLCKAESLVAERDVELNEQIQQLKAEQKKVAELQKRNEALMRKLDHAQINRRQ